MTRRQRTIAAAAEKERVKTSLSEVRTLVLGAQILLGFQYRGAFEAGFPSLPAMAQYLQVASLVLLVASTACLIAPAPYHRIVSDGHATGRMERYTKRMALLALGPFALALGINFSIALAGQGRSAWPPRAGPGRRWRRRPCCAGSAPP